ncbi:hypothetical protein [Streptomyces sp. KS 21]|uniref:hypothetical protein n=1 Tax=Streptomyces sp. KS 21 TaxID=2485150 RepID=UPI00106299F8|nr:hypothetical protein [Streptomyces sp. KS 21]
MPSIFRAAAPNIEVYGLQADELADAPGQFYLLEDARAEYQRHSWTADLPSFRSTRASAPLLATWRTPDVDHCGNCGTTVAIGGWMMASLGLSCPDCYDVMSGEPGRHDSSVPPAGVARRRPSGALRRWVCRDTLDVTKETWRSAASDDSDTVVVTGWPSQLSPFRRTLLPATGPGGWPGRSFLVRTLGTDILGETT